MAGKPKTPVFQYDGEGKYIQTYESRNDVFAKYYDGKHGELFAKNKVFKALPDGTYVTKERIGRIGLLKAIAIDNDPLCDDKPEVPISIYNRAGKRIATFSSLHIACLLTGKSYSSTRSALTKGQRFTGGDGMLFKEEPDLKL